MLVRARVLVPSWIASGVAAFRVQVRELEEAFLLVDENLLLASAQCIGYGGGRVCVFVHAYVCARVCVRECTAKRVMLHVRHTQKQTDTHM